MAILSATTIRTALIDYRVELVRMQAKYPSVMDNHETIDDIDRALMEIEGNCLEVSVTQHTCNSIL